MTAPILLLDVMDTLVREPWFEDAPAFFGMTMDELLAVKHPTSWIDFEKGRIGEQEFLDGFFRDGRAYDQQGFVAHLRQGYRWLPGMEALLGELAEAGRAMHALSNYPVWYRSIEEDLRLTRFLEWTFVSCKTGFRKPDASAYTAALEQLGVPPERCLFVDDRQENVNAAQALGLDAVRFRDAAALRTALQERGCLP